MARRVEKSSLLNHPVRSRAAQTSLLSPIPELQGPLSLLRHLSCLSCNICVNSKASLLILVWSVLVGFIYLTLVTVITVVGFVLRNNLKHYNTSINLAVLSFTAGYAFLALVLLLYPVSGYVADIYYGRYKIVTFSLILIWLATILLSAAVIIGYRVKFDHFGKLGVPTGIFAVLTVILMIVGLACYQANIIQLGLDQLLEAPSEKLGLFIHWIMWSYTLGNFITVIIFVFTLCYLNDKPINNRLSNTVGAIPFLLCAVFTILVLFTICKRAWFYTEPGQSNPYKTVFKVLNFARKNKYPLRRSAFTFCDDFIPSRIDFAKERYGGPFTTPQVEDVKTLLRIVAVFLSLGPLMILEIHASFALFPLFSLHTGSAIQFFYNRSCTAPAQWVIVQSGSLGYIASIIFMPLYMWIVYSLLRKRVPKIFNRLLVGIVISIAGVVCLLVVDLIGHFHYRQQHRFTNSTSETCLFTSPLLYSKESHPNVLNLHWSASIVPCVLLSIGTLLMKATTFEFISAQSPHSMKGLLVGVFFAIKGLFQFISAAAVVPFAIPGIWNSINAVTNCGFGYYLFTIVVALVGLVVFSVVVRRYRYRERDERPFDTRFAERYYERIINSTQRSAPVLYSPSDELLYQSELEHTASGSDSISSVSRDYGTIKELRHTLID